MRYEELPGPLEGWTYDEHGVIYTASGYRTTARQIEFCMWMYDCLTSQAKQWMIRSDERPGALKPLYEPNDLKSGRRGEKKNLQPEREAVAALRARAQPPGK